jgi:hypothetical protein
MMALGILQFNYLKSRKHLISWLLEKKNFNSNETQCDQKWGTKWTIMYWKKINKLKLATSKLTTSWSCFWKILCQINLKIWIKNLLMHKNMCSCK